MRAAQAPQPILNNETLLNGILGGSGVQPVLLIANSEGVPKIERGNSEGVPKIERGTFRAGAAYFH